MCWRVPENRGGRKAVVRVWLEREKPRSALPRERSSAVVSTSMSPEQTVMWHKIVLCQNLWNREPRSSPAKADRISRDVVRDKLDKYRMFAVVQDRSQRPPVRGSSDRSGQESP